MLRIAVSKTKLELELGEYWVSDGLCTIGFLPMNAGRPGLMASGTSVVSAVLIVSHLRSWLLA